MMADDPVLQEAGGASTAERAAVLNTIARALTARDETGKSGIAATVVRNDKIIATGENEVHLQSDPTRHAEMVAITRREGLGNTRSVGLRPDLDAATVRDVPAVTSAVAPTSRTASAITLVAMKLAGKDSGASQSG